MKQEEAFFVEAQSRGLFKRYVQRVAFQLTLSGPMIAALQWVRDDPGLYMTEHPSRDGIRADNGLDLFIVEMRALERRGLVWFNVQPANRNIHTAHKSRKLTYTGELTCELLVEAGMMPPQAIPQKTKARKAA